MADHRGDVPSTIDCQLSLAVLASASNLWLKRAFIAARSESGAESGINRTSLPVVLSVTQSESLFESHSLRTSPIPGPPNIRINSDVEPPLSEMGIT